MLCVFNILFGLFFFLQYQSSLVLGELQNFKIKSIETKKDIDTSKTIGFLDFLWNPLIRIASMDKPNIVSYEEQDNLQKDIDSVWSKLTKNAKTDEEKLKVVADKISFNLMKIFDNINVEALREDYGLSDEEAAKQAVMLNKA